MPSCLNPGDPGLKTSFCIPARTAVAWCLLAAIWLPVVSASATESFTPHAAEYKVRISVVGGRLQTRLQETETGYVATHAISPTGLSRLVARGSVSEVAEFELGDGGVTPLVYQTDDTLDRDEVHARVRFDWDANQASGTLNEQALLTELEGLTYDRISIQYALMHDLLNNSLDSEYRMFEVDELKLLNVRSIGSKKIKVPAGTFEAVGIQHQAENSSRVTTLWCVEELGYLPVIIEQHRKGKLRVKATLRNYTPETVSAE